MTDLEIKNQLDFARAELEKLDISVRNTNTKNALLFVKNCITELEQREKDNIEITIDYRDEHQCYREGDVLAIEDNGGGKTIIVYKSNDKNRFRYYACLSDGKSDLYVNNSADVSCRRVRKATGEESELLYQALDEEKLIINIEEHKLEYDFKPFDKVLVRGYDDELWKAAIYSHTFVNEGRTEYVASTGYWNQCIPYESNEELIGTNNKPKIEL